jgi:hypothetical protein
LQSAPVGPIPAGPVQRGEMGHRGRRPRGSAAGPPRDGPVVCAVQSILYLAAGRRRRPAVAAVGVVPLRGSSASGSPHRQKGAESRTGGDGRRALVLSSGSLDHLRRASDGGLPLESVLECTNGGLPLESVRCKASPPLEYPRTDSLSTAGRNTFHESCRR